MEPEGESLVVGATDNGRERDIAVARYLANGGVDSSCGLNDRSIGTAADYGTLGPVLGNGTTVTATTGSDIVTGAGTGWLTANRGRGDAITIPSGGVDYTIRAVVSDTDLQLTIPFTGATGAGQTYRIARQF